jgi:hypothetical protein
MATLTRVDLRDSAPPVPGSTERAAVAARANQLVRRRRYLQGAGALSAVAVAALAVGMAALATGGTSSSPRSQPIAAASAPATVAPVPATSAPTAPVAAAAGTVTISGHVSGVPAGATLTLTLTGQNGTFTAIADGAGNFSMSGVPTGEYTGTWVWSSSDGTATSAGRLGGLNVTADQNVTFSV